MKVLFICKYNAGRSRMAAAFFNKLSKKNKAKSAGISSNVSLTSNWKGVGGTVTVMKESGINVPCKLGKAVTRKDVESADRIVVLLDKKQQHILPKYITTSTKTEYHGIPDSDARASDFLNQQRRNRDMVKEIVLKLIKEIG